MVAVCCLVVFFSAKAQLPQDLKITNFDGATGFYSRVVSSIIKDNKGFLWIGTSDGLYRYDGYSFRNYRKLQNDTNSLADNNITQLALGADHKIWMGLSTGVISSFDPASGKFKNYPIRYKGQPVSGNVLMLVVDGKNDVWFSISHNGLWHLDVATGVCEMYNLITDKDTDIPKDRRTEINTVYSGVESKPGFFWLATHNGLYRFDKKNKLFIPERKMTYHAGEFRDDDFTCITKDGDVLWLGSWAGGLTKYNTATHEWKNFKHNLVETKKYTTNIISNVKPRSENELWVTSTDKGVGIFDKKKEQFTYYSSTRTDIPGKLCYTFETGKNDNLWLIHEWGLTRIQPREKQFHYTETPVTKTDNNQFYYLRDMIEDADHLYIATTLADGLHVVNKKTGKTKQYAVKTLAGEETFLSVYKLLKDSRGIVWVISRDYIYQFDTKKEQLVLVAQPHSYPLQKSSSWFRNIAEDKKGNIWITSTQNGVFAYSPKTNTYRHFYHDTNNKNSLSSDNIYAVAVDKSGRVWVGGTNGCFAYFDDTLNHFVNYEWSADEKRTTANNISGIASDHYGNIWAGTDAGLVQVDATQAKPVIKKIYTAQDGLRGDVAYSIQEDPSGNIWCATASALCMINPVTQRVNSVLLQNDVIKSITNKLFLSVANNQLQVLTYGGYYSFDPVSLQDQQQDSVITVTSFRVKDKEYYYEEGLTRDGKIKLKSTENLFSFEFAVLDYKQSDDHQYAYMLEGFDKDWVNAGNRRYASYTNIPGGTYFFKVKSLNTYGDANSSVMTIPLHVNAPVYLRWWFLFLLACVFTAVLYVFYRFRLEKEREILRLNAKTHALEKEKTQVQYENLKQHLNPHFLFNSLTSLGSLIRINQKMAADFLDGMSKIYRYILQSKDSELVSLKDEIKFIQTFISLQKTRFEEGLQVNLDIDEEYFHQKIVPVTLQNLVENAIKHNIIDTETPLVIDIFIKDGYLLVRNNMQKKKFVETSNKQGLDNLISLYKYLSDEPMLVEETGTYFTVKIPLI
jgi:ligand-binding sensor domain-containing protein